MYIVRVVKVASAVLLACALSACSGGGEGSKDDSRHGTGGDQPADETARISVPSTYDNSQGWQEPVAAGGLDGTVPLASAPRSNLVTYLDSTGQGYVLKARDAKTGKLRWRSRPWTPPVPEESDTETGEAEPPKLSVITSGGAEYVVAYAYGEKQKDELSRKREVVEVVSYRADASGQNVAPLKTADVPVLGEPDGINADGSGVVVRETDSVEAVNVTTGRIKSYESCDLCDEEGDAFATVDRGLVTSTPATGYQVLGAWEGADTVPAEYRDRYANAIAVTEDYVVGTWKDLSADDSRWVVHDSRSGKALVTMQCSPPEGTGTANPKLYTPSVSANGRYLVVGTGAFDLERKKGYCFEGTDERNPIELTTVDDNGVAYGASVPTDTSEPSPQVQVSLDTGTPKPLPSGAIVPAADVAGHGFFTAPTGSGKLALGLIAYPHR
ncbi:hypothetical protein [Streptomyces sp. Rer75]|uniref:hypothetical protein n=1 Tax=Streptomyces sp. Rer75 TaxID=2750011 RepID=UPI0015CF9B58|nr:hypothetical protein [Streptomyces sp. Rer75]QLH19332.1 hypothetical protein HYQ63_00335 [Streptomyces sp. Rer75]